MSYRIVLEPLRIRFSIQSQVLLDVVPALRVAQAGTRLTVYRLLDIEFRYKSERKSLFIIKFDINDLERAIK